MNSSDIRISFEDTSIAFSSKSNKALKKTHWLFSMMNKGWLVKMGTKMIKLGFNIGLPIKGIVKQTLFHHFCGGESIQDCTVTIDALHDYKIGTILDYSVEGAKDAKGFDQTTEEIIRTIKKAQENPDKIPFSVFKVTGIASMGLLTKIQAKETLSETEKTAWKDVQERVNKICKIAFEKDVRLFIDAEDSWIQDVIDKLCYEMMQKYNQEKAIIYNTYQLYRHEVLANLKTAFLEAQKEGYFLGAKLVRGAYMEKERERAKEQNYTDPIQPTKEATDRDFDLALEFCMQNIEQISFCAGTHNEESSYKLAELMNEKQLENTDTRVFFAQLYGMSDHISYNLANAGYNVAKYVPYGPIKAVMPYLFRRAEENTSVKGQTSRELGLIKKEIHRRKKAK